MSRPITPAMTVAELLAAWPDLEPVLIAQAPAFQKLRNPVLRRTIARVATLEQAAAVAGLSARDLVTTLRLAAGQAVATTPDPLPRPDVVSPCALHAASSGGDPHAMPASAASNTIDADALLEAGQAPLGPIMKAAVALAPGDRLQVISAFRPVPLIDALEARGFACDCRREPDGRHVLTVAHG